MEAAFYLVKPLTGSSCVWSKMVVYLKMNNLLSFTHPYDVSNLYEFLSSGEDSFLHTENDNDESNVVWTIYQIFW